MGAENPHFPGVFSFYGGLCRKVLADRALFSSFVVAATLQGLGHVGTALAAGLLGRALYGLPAAAGDGLPAAAGDGLPAGAGGALFSSTFRFVSSPATLAFVGVLATAVKGAGATLGATVQSRLAQNVAGSVRHRLATQLLTSGSNLPPSQLAARAAVRLREVERGVEEGFLGGLKASFTLAPLVVALCCVSPRLALGALFIVPPFAVATAFARRTWKRSYGRALALSEALHGEVDELVVHMDVWRAYGAGRPVCDSLATLGEQVGAVASRAEASRAALSSANEVLAAAALLGCFSMAHWFALPVGDGTFVAFAVLVFMAYRPLRDLGDARTALERGADALAALETVPRPMPIYTLPVSAASRTWGRELLVVDAVGVQRRSDDGDGEAAPRAPVSTSFVARPGEIVAVVGPTGAGKTTLLRALLGLEPSAFGRVTYGTEDVTRAGVGPGARPFAWAPQDAPVLAGTIEDNVLLGRTNEHQAAEVLASIGAGKLAREWTGIEIGAAGRPVSGGERKWISLARAIASGLPVLLLDEPTAGLDPASQATVLAALKRLRRTRTIVLVSHQSETVDIADRVVDLGSTCDGEPTCDAPHATASQN